MNIVKTEAPKQIILGNSRVIQRVMSLYVQKLRHYIFVWVTELP